MTVPHRAARKSAQSLGLAAAILLLAGCLVEAPGEKVKHDEQSGFDVGTWTDPDSGCRYVTLSADLNTRYATFALAPKLRPDGSPDCGR